MAALAAITYLAVFGAFIYGWVWNIITVFTATDMATNELIIRLFGIPIDIIGAFLGYF